MGNRAALEPWRKRITWDAILHSVADIAQLPFKPACVNMKPSRFGFDNVHPSRSQQRNVCFDSWVFPHFGVHRWAHNDRSPGCNKNVRKKIS